MATTDTANISARTTLTIRPVRPSLRKPPIALPAPAQRAAVGTTTRAIVAATTTVPVTGERVGGRNAVTAPNAKIQPFGFTTWKAAAPSNPSGRATVARL